MVRGNHNAPAPVPVEDSFSPYYLHPSDNPGLQLVSQLLDGSNYINWSRSISTALLPKNKLLFVNGVLLRPSNDDLLFSAWLRCNSMVVSWLRNFISPHICSSIMYLDDAHEIWPDLRERFSQCDSARTYQLKQQLMAPSQGNSDVNTYFTSLRTVWDEYKHTQPLSWCTCNHYRCDSASRWHKQLEDDCTVQFLIGLNHSFSQIRSSILSMVSLPSLSKVFSLVIQEERQRNIDGASSHISPSPSEMHYSVNAASSFYGRLKLLCSHCGKTNHTVDRCFTLHGFPPGFGHGKGKEPPKEYASSKLVNFVEAFIPDSSDKTVPVASLPSVDQCQ
ncbi:uncharacterized protein LOC121760568 [Salvia splendens]|uniref:uncharacterized protein LOC121760568 n=1 Tax=Salvia splendens TaxID=180675 RepID=UPI001C265744|nr:uncharacterized protein LOC121760568 [Salvia splendens]